MDWLVDYFRDTSAWELTAVLLSLAYLVLALRESVWCWPAALVSTAIYTVLFWHVSLLMDSALNVYYMAMAVYGFYLWHRPRQSAQAPVSIHRWAGKNHVFAIGAVLVASLVSGSVLDRYTGAVWPYLDSFTTWGSVLTTYMVARKVLENWLYWIVIDSVAMGLYIERGLYPTALLMALYLVLCVLGWWRWRRELEEGRCTGALHASA